MSESPIDAIRHLTRAWTKKDAAEMARWLTPDIIEIGPAFEEVLSGQRHFFRKYRAYLRGPLEVISYRILRPQIKMLSPRLALVYFRYGMRTRSGAADERSRGKESMLVQLNRGRWRVRCIHWHRDH